jgi:hypothetical protein
MTKEEMLGLIRADREGQVINSVKSFSENEFGFYNVIVDMEGSFFETKVTHTEVTLPYPLAAYKNLSYDDMKRWKEKYMTIV